MQKTKNIRLLISLTVMILFILILFVLNDLKNTPSIDKTLFSIPDLEKVDRVKLQSSKGEIELKFDGAKWMVNKDHEADPQMITVLFATLKQVEVKRKVASILKDSVQNKIQKNGVKISCFVRETLGKEFWCEGNAQKSETYFQLPNDIPYLVTIPGYRVHVASVFEVAAIDWRDKRVFNFNWQNIKSLEVNFPNDPKQNFKASFQNNLFSIEGIETDTTKLDKYMDALFQLRADRILDSVQIKNLSNEILKQPIMEINIKDIGNQAYPLKLFPLEKGNQFVIGEINDDIVLLNPQTLHNVIKTKTYFARH